MKQFLGRIATAGLAIGLLCTVGDRAFAKDPNPVRPYRARTQETQISLGVCDPGVPALEGFVSEEWVGVGNSTHGGRSTDHFCVVVTDVRSPSDPFILELGGQGTATTANGDEVFFLIENGLINVDEGCQVTGTLTFTGGTGRFEHASGTAECISTHVTPCGPSQMTTCAGTISY